MVMEEQHSDMELAAEKIPVPQVQKPIEMPLVETNNQVKGISHNKPRFRKRALHAAILKQMEFYFSDANLTKDRFLGNLIKEDPYIDLSVFIRFNKIRELTTDINRIAKALQASTMLSISENGLKVRRITPIKQKKNTEDCTVYVQNLPPGATHDWLNSIFSQYGNVAYVSLPHYKINKKIKGFAFVEFDTPEEAEECLKDFKKMDCLLPSHTNPDEILSITTFDNAEKDVNNESKVIKRKQDETNLSSDIHSKAKESRIEIKSEKKENKLTEENSTESKKIKRKHSSGTDEDTKIADDKIMLEPDSKKLKKYNKHVNETTNNYSHEIEPRNEITNNHPREIEPSNETTNNHSREIEPRNETTNNHSREIEPSNETTNNHSREIEPINETTNNHSCDIEPKNVISNESNVLEKSDEINLDEVSEEINELSKKSKKKSKKSKSENDINVDEISNNDNKSDNVAIENLKVTDDIDNEEAAMDKKKKRKRKRKSRIDDNNISNMGLQIMAKKHWKHLRNKYLELQRSKMKQLKQHLKKTRDQWNNFDKTKSDKEEIEEKEKISNIDKTTMRSFSFTPGVIVKIKLDEPCTDARSLKAELKGNNSIKYIDVSEGASEVYVRCDTPESAQSFVQKSNKENNMVVLKDDDERIYWDKILQDREEKLGKKVRVKQRGRSKLLKKAEKELGKHIIFDEVD
ncbi:PREDICTED: la-related protein 7 [Polistes canadensis]|uniref:la-related protein 7 n=1 Tax=Polistes canadensis TaxID=91411 RepID=UPI000718C11A|nr:PREDICTED: la-related protein 7 [Polistes canadensis]